MLRTNVPLITRHDYEAVPEGPPYYQVIDIMIHARTGGEEHWLVDPASVN